MIDRRAAGASPVEQSSIARSMEVLLAVVESAEPVTAKAVATMLDIKLGTVYHVVKTLRQMGLVARKHGGGLVPGPRAIAVGYSLHRRSGVTQELSALLVELRNLSRETCYISTLSGQEIVLRESLESVETLRVSTLPPGYSSHPHARAAARAVLAFLPEPEVAAIFRHYDFTALTENTISSAEEFFADLRRVAKAGHSTDLGELYEGVCCVAAPYFGPDDRPMGSFTISAPSIRYKQRANMYAALVTRAASLATKASSGIHGTDVITPPVTAPG